MYGSVKKIYSLSAIVLLAIAAAGFVYVKNWYTNADFGKSFGPKAEAASKKLRGQQALFAECSRVCGVTPKFMQALVFPEVMRYNSIKDGVETESLRTLYVQLGEDYANFSIGLFQMKPTFAEQLENKARKLLNDSIYKELQLEYKVTGAEDIRAERVERLCDDEFQMVYLTAFIAICNRQYQYKHFSSELEQLQWYATVYNAGFDKTDAYIAQKIKQENFYLGQGMPGKKFRYAAIVGWYYQQLGPLKSIK
jgi:hypothetical protein